MRKYRELLAIRNTKILLITSFPARVAYSMVGLALFFKVERLTDSVAYAGIALGLNTFANSVTAGLRGSALDRWGQKWPIRILVPLYASGLLVLEFTTSKTWIFPLSLLMGLVSPPINLSVRPLWKVAVPESSLRTAYALDTSVINSTRVFGPLLASTLALSPYPSSALILCALFIAVGGLSLGFTKISSTWVPEKKSDTHKSVWRIPAMQLLMVEAMFVGFGWGAFDVGIPAFATLEKIPGWSGPIFACLALTSVIGGLTAGLISRKTSALKGLLRTYGMWMLATIPLALTYPGWSMATIALFIGFFGGAVQVFYWEVLEAVRPKGTAVSALGWIWTVDGSFMALGAALGGVIASEFSPRITLLATTISLSLGLLVLFFGRKILEPGNRITSEEEDRSAIEHSAPPQ
ncbi:MAG: MFS transporter [Candidatus Nanopelagicaceae bacterium]